MYNLINLPTSTPNTPSPTPVMICMWRRNALRLDVVARNTSYGHIKWPVSGKLITLQYHEFMRQWSGIPAANQRAELRSLFVRGKGTAN
ncbi:hypothetical protein E2C01_092664 [Portunus trituberculatus]|uniref:Uncharacterized protein n=1 Tax=Portunus trituberculatus TaxID=210409 RepID=A0A5B7JMM3_PORTR|nr:hypothetical protein [Portunus trituberculatus]